jgi:Ca2+-binding EF-hand superfamily protein
MNRKHAILAAVVLALGSTLALAAAGDEPRGQRMRERADAAFADSDSNHDGRLSQSEWQSAQLRKATEKFRRMDANRDGSLSREEMQAAHAQRMHRRSLGMREKLRELDADGDRQLSRAELRGRMPRLEQDFGRLDANADGKLSREEIRAGRERRREDAQR